MSWREKERKPDHRHLFRVDSGRADFFDLVHLYAVDVFHHQHRPGRVVPMDLRDVNLLDLLEIPGEFFNAPGLDHHVELAGDIALEFPDKIRCAYDPADFQRFFRLAGQKIHQAKVLFYPAVDSGADDFDRDLLARMQLCYMHLAHRCRRDGFFIEFGEDFEQGPSEFSFDNRLDLLEGDRRHHVLELFEFSYVFGRENVGAGAHELPQLHETRPQFFQQPAGCGGRTGTRCAETSLRPRPPGVFSCC